MRNLKRALSLALAMVMVLSMMVIGASAASYDEFTDKDEIVNKEAVNVLVELGVIEGKDTGAFDPTGIITRGEMAKIICVVLNKGQDPNLGAVNSNTYTDTVG
ncbi:MAG TPA: S-layer homology domain-containing protein, partial [Candidatus Intestinimonas stercorigallinarum]|nr:S-layer homology domain-containing protein [Candidatus Intestinimonas stercorigallinarum]